MRELAGQPLLVHAVRALAEARSIDVIVVAAPEGELAAVKLMLDPVADEAELMVVAGGETRQQSVMLALRVLPSSVTVCL